MSKDLIIKYSQNKNLINKGDPTTKGWINTESTIEALLSDIYEYGYAFSQAVLKPGVGTKKPERSDVQEAWMIPIDIDNEVRTWNKDTHKYDKCKKTIDEGYYSRDDARNDPFVKEFAAFIYTTPNNTDEHHRFRIVFVLNEPITTIEDYARISSILINKFQSDKSCSNIDRLYYGSKGCMYKQIYNTISIADILDLENESIEHTKELKRYNDSNLNGTITEELAAEMLNCIPGDGIDYYEWFGVLSAIGNYFDETTALRLVETWAPDCKYGTDYKLKHRGTKYNIGTVIHMAKRYGFDTNLIYGRLPDLSQINRKVSQIMKSDGKADTVIEVADDDPERTPFKHPLTESGNAERFFEQNKDAVIFNHTSGLWHIWNGHKWEIDLKRSILNYALSTVRRMDYELADIKKFFFDKKMQLDREQEKLFRKWILSSESRAKLESMIYLASSKMAAVHSDFDKDLYMLNLLNGTYNLKTHTLQAHNPSDLLTKACNVVFDKDAICPHFDAFLEKIFNFDYELINFVKRVIGLSLCGHQSEEILIFCHGSGKNGKSVLFNVLNHLFGDYFQKAPTDMLLQKHNESIPNDIARLPGARMVVAEELPENRSLNENKIKNLTGGDSISARFLHKEFFDFKPTHTLWIYGNHKPNIKGTDEGIWRRICLIPFLVTIPESERRPQYELMEEFEAEMAGIFNLAIEGWKDYQKNGLNPPQIVLNYTKEYRDEQDQVADFLNDSCDFDVTSKIKSTELLENYFKWCQANQEHPLRKNSFYKRIQQIDNVKSESGTGNAKCFVGIRLKGNIF